jgi:predicted transport protein
MALYKNVTGTLKKLDALTLDKEKSLQQLIETNLGTLLGLRFLATEYTTTLGGRIDTLAVDEGGAPVIIEYKRNRNDNVINQALSSLKWLKTQKPGFFEKLMIDKLGADTAKRIGLDWANAWVICVAESYSKFDLDTVEVVQLRIELHRYRFYQDSLFSLDKVSLDESKSASPGYSTPIVSSSAIPTTTNASVDSLLTKASPQIRELFEQLRERIRALDEGVVEKPTALYVAYRLSNNFAEVHIGKNQLKVHLRPTDYLDPKHAVEKVPDGYNWTMDRRTYLKRTEDLDYALGLIEQSYKNVL